MIIINERSDDLSWFTASDVLFKASTSSPESVSSMDETDSGLDVDALKSTSEAVNQLRSSDRSFIIITHYLRLLEYIEPDFVHEQNLVQYIQAASNSV